MMRMAVYWRWARRSVQVLAFLLFVYLLLETRQVLESALPHDLFFRLDPLTSIAASLASRQWLPVLGWSVLPIALTLAFGRVWCGWLCPMGSVLDWVRLRRQKGVERPLPTIWRQVKYAVLFVILFAALFGNLTVLVLDPITLITRTVASAALPGLDAAVTSAETNLYSIEPLQGPIEAFDGLVRGTVLPTEPRSYEQALPLAILFIAVVALNAIRPRFWCRYLCPLGALLALISKISWLRHRLDQTKCISCGRCARVCPTGTIDPTRAFAADPGECTLCLNCWPACPTGAISFAGQVGGSEWRTYDPSRRQALASIAIAVVGVGLLRHVPLIARTSSFLVRPPGAKEGDLQSKCLRCGQCLQVCPTAGLQPSLNAAGWEGLWTPVLVPRLGYCDYSCNSCGQVCPTGAISPLSLDDKRQTVIGLAAIDQNRCIPWSESRDCIICEEMCPISEKAITLEDVSVLDASGQVITVRRPSVVRERCIGCGICETKCPIAGEAAIRVYAPI